MSIIDVRFVVVVWQKENFHGYKRTIIEDASNLRLTDFNDEISAIGIHVLEPPQNQPQPIISFFQKPDFGGRELAVPPGLYPSLKRMGFDNQISSIKVKTGFDESTRPRGIYEINGDRRVPVELEEHRIIPQAAPFHSNGIALKVFAGKENGTLYEDTHVMHVVENAANLSEIYGGEWNDSIFTVDAIPLIGYPSDDFGYVRLHRGTDFRGGHIDIWPQIQKGEFFAADSVEWRLGDYLMKGVISSIEFLPPPRPAREVRDRNIP